MRVFGYRDTREIVSTLRRFREPVGLFQMLPASRMPTVSAERTAAEQIRWGLEFIRRRYGPEPWEPWRGA